VKIVVVWVLDDPRIMSLLLLYGRETIALDARIGSVEKQLEDINSEKK